MTSEDALKWLNTEEGKKAQETCNISYSSDHGGGLIFTSRIKPTEKKKNLFSNILNLINKI
jgi:hypothetical protein